MTGRRTFLVLCGTALTSGCLGSGGESTPTPKPDSDSDGYPDTQDDYPDASFRARQLRLVSESVTLDPDSHEAYDFSNLDSQVMIRYDVTVQGESAIDVLLFNRENYSKYQSEDSPKYYSKHSAQDVTSLTLEWNPLGPGEYALVLDYTDYGSRHGTRQVTVDFEMEIATVPD